MLAVAALVEHTVQLPVWQMLIIYLVPYLVVGYDVVGEAFEGICHGEVFDEDFLMFVATVGAMCIGFLPGAEPQFAEAVFVMLFFQVGELFEHYAEHRSRRSIRALMDIRPDAANVLRNGKIQTVGNDVQDVTLRLMEAIVTDEDELITVYYGKDTKEDDAQALTDELASRYGDCDVEMQMGGQPLYDYLVSVE